MTVRILIGDVRDKLAELADESVHCVVTSPPYWGLRDYDVEGQLGQEPTLQLHVNSIVEVFQQVHRVLRKDGTLWLNYGDCYAASANGRSAADTKAAGKDDRTFRDKPFSTVGPIHAPSGSDPFRRDKGRRGGGLNSDWTLKPKDLCMMPARLALALQADGWCLRSEIVWSKLNPMPESVTDRPTSSHEKIFLFSKAKWVGAERPLVLRDGDAQWLAALIDGEGTICFQERKNGKEWSPTVGIRLSVVNTCRPLLERIQAIIGYGGSDTPSPRWRNDGSSGRSVFTWQVTNAKAAAVISAIRPHLIAKATQADLAMACHTLNQKHRGRRVAKTTASELAEKRRLAEACSALNHGHEINLSWFSPPRRGRWTSQSYYFDAEAVREAAEYGRREQPAATWDRTGIGARSVCGATKGANPETGRNLRNVWNIATQPYPEAHFATFPTALVEPCIKAGTSEKGCCPECGAPWVREVKRVDQGWDGSRYGERVVASTGGAKTGGTAKSTLGSNNGKLTGKTATTGWSPSCFANEAIYRTRCVPGGNPVPCTVLDPFAGAGTTGLVADRLGRDAILIELNPEYAALAEKRLHKDAGMFAEVV